MFGCWPSAQVETDVPERGAPMMKIGRGGELNTGFERSESGAQFGTASSGLLMASKIRLSKLTSARSDLKVLYEDNRTTNKDSVTDSLEEA